MTIPLDPHYIPAFSIEDVLLDKDTGAPLSGGLVYFEKDSQRGVAKPVYQITGTSPDYTFTQLSNPVTLSSIGTFEDSLGNPVIPYFYPYNSNLDVELYYVRVTSSEDVPQFDREAVPYIAESNSADDSSFFVNQISNPQFAIVDFDTSASDYVYNFNAASLEVVQIAPDWFIEVSCPAAGTVTVSQLTPVGTLNIISNPGTILNISSTGLTRLRLRQRMYGSPNLWGSGFLAGSFVAKTYSGTDVDLTLYYSQSDGTVSDLAILTATLNADGSYDSYSGSVEIPASTSTEEFPDAYVDIEFDIPLSIEIDITSVFVVGTGETSISTLTYNQITFATQVDRLFHYYKYSLDFKSIPSMLTGWDFPLNPAQFGSSGNLASSAAYIWDQTIAVRGSTNIPYARNSVTGGIQFTTAGTVPDAFLLCQYLTGSQAKKILGTPMSVNLNAYRGSAGGAVSYRVYLYRGSSAAVVPTLGNLIGSLASNGTFVKNTTAGQGLNWTEIPRGNLGAVAGTLSTVPTNDEIAAPENDYGYSGWEVTDATEIGDTDKFCIIVTFSYAAISTVIVVNSVSLVPGNIPTRPAPKTLNDTILECQFYYQKSFLYGVTPAQNVGNTSGESYGVQVSGSGASGAFGPIVRFPTTMINTPVVDLYNPAAANAQIRDTATGTDWSTSAASNETPQGFVATGSTPGGSSSGNGSSVHWTADARLGIV